ncbi:hypothetical protein F220043C3_16220 [Enterocloster asparagiformis]|uniref:hypothetical protein n=1 Tax=Enterocloster asparagiformis TaxID=333367 RepID=UPI0034AE9F13
MQNEREGYVFDEFLSADEMTEKLLLAIKGAAFFYSVLKGWGYRTYYPIALVVETLETGDAIADKLAIFNKKVISTNTPSGEFLKTLGDGHDDLSIMSYTPGRYLSDNMETLFSLCQCGEYGDHSARTILMIIFSKVVPEEYKDKFSLVIEVERRQLENLTQASMETYLDTLKSYILAYEQVIEHEIKKNLQCDLNKRDERFWYAVVIVMGLVFSGGEAAAEETIRSNLYHALQTAYDLSDSYEFYNQIPALFREVFDQSIPEVSKLLPEEKAMEVSAKDLAEMVLYDTEHYYIPESVFTKICKPLSKVCTVNQIKDVLAKEGILCTQGQGRIYKTIKKNIGSSNTPVRFVWLKRRLLEEDTMEMSFADIYWIRRRSDV